MRRFLFLAALAVACARPSGHPEFVLRLAVVGPLEPFGPAVHSGYATAVQDLVFQTFLAPDERGNLRSPVGTWERVDLRRARVRIDPALRFSDGSPVRLGDVLGSLSGEGLIGRERGDWVEIETADGRSPIEPLLLYAMLFKATPAGPIGTGPFAVEDQGAWRIALRRVRPAVRRIGRVEFLAYPTPRDVLAHVIRGDANSALGIDERQMELVEGIPGLRAVRGPSPVAGSVIFSMKRLTRAERRRIAASVPVQEVAKVAFDARCASADDRGTAAPPPAGRGIDILTLHSHPSSERAALALRRYWGHRGGALMRVSQGEFMQPLRRGDFDVAVTSMLVWPPSSLSIVWGTAQAQNLTGYSNPLADAAFAAGDYAGAEKELERDPPFVKLCRLERYAAFDSRIRNPRLGWWGQLDLLPDWEVEP